MQNIKPISELRNYSKLLNEVKPGEPVFLTKNGHGKYVLIAIEDYREPKRHVQYQRNRLEINADGKAEKPSVSKTDVGLDSAASLGDNGSSIHGINRNVKSGVRFPEGKVITRP